MDNITRLRKFVDNWYSEIDLRECLTPFEIEALEDLLCDYSKLETENKNLKKQLDYIRNGEYYNQLRFENKMLQHIAEHSEVSKEDKEFIDCTHRNTELLEENQKLKEQLENNTKIQVADHKYASQKEDEVIELKEEMKHLKTALNTSEEQRQKTIDELKRGIIFCENDSSGVYDKCNIAINREKAVLEILESSSDK